MCLLSIFTKCEISCSVRSSCIGLDILCWSVSMSRVCRTFLILSCSSTFEIYSAENAPNYLRASNGLFFCGLNNFTIDNPSCFYKFSLSQNFLFKSPCWWLRIFLFNSNNIDFWSSISFYYRSSSCCMLNIPF